MTAPADFAGALAEARFLARPEDGDVFIHRDLGMGFTHEDSHHCGCCPVLVTAADMRSADRIWDDLERRQ